MDLFVPSLAMSLNTGTFGGGGLLGYLAIAISQYTIADRQGRSNAWFAFIPVLNLVLLFEMAEMPVWYALLIFAVCIGWIPLLILCAMAWSKIARANGKPELYGWLCVVPVLNFIMPIVIAFG